MSALEVRTTALGGGPLARGALAGELPADWFSPPPAGVREWRARVQAARARDGEAPAGQSWYAVLREAIAPGGAAAERLARTVAGDGVVVTTGQQPGLFGGPIYTWSKALTALAVADALEHATGVPVAPVFWAATDDSDFAEASTTHVARRGGVETLTLTPAPGEPIALRDVPLPDVGELLAALERGAGSAAYREPLDLARRCYAPGQTVGSAYVALLRAVLEPLGIAVLDSAHPATRAAYRPLMNRALERRSEIARALAGRDRELRERGFGPQVATLDDLTLVFQTVEGGRNRIPLAAAAPAPPTELGPNVLLRPIAERAVLPTVAYLGGPGEIAYFAQATAVAEALGVAAPLILPRWSGLIVEPHIARILSRYELTPDDFRDAHGAEGRLAERRLPPDVRSRLLELGAQIGSTADALRAGLGTADGPLVPPTVVDGAARAMRQRLDRLERRLVAGVKRREREMMTDLATARAALRPLGRPQERVLNLLPMLAREGPALLAAMLDEARTHADLLVATPAAAGTATR